jgi:hypothetical protein
LENPERRAKLKKLATTEEIFADVLAKREKRANKRA